MLLLQSTLTDQNETHYLSVFIAVCPVLVRASLSFHTGGSETSLGSCGPLAGHLCRGSVHFTLGVQPQFWVFTAHPNPPDSFTFASVCQVLFLPVH